MLAIYFDKNVLSTTVAKRDHFIENLQFGRGGDKFKKIEKPLRFRQLINCVIQ